MSLTIDQWCDVHGFSRGMFYRLKQIGQAPRIFRVGRAVRITEAADAEWLAEREVETANIPGRKACPARSAEPVDTIATRVA
jgi:predicted DNA-binding transcriptional regulator AlpA